MENTNDPLFNTKQAAALLGLSHQTLEKWRSLGIGPSYLKLGNKAVRYRRSALLTFIDGGADV